MAKVTIDARHGGYDSGATYNGRNEKDDNLEIALAVGELLEQRGVEVEYTRVTDVYDSPTAKAQMANEQGADVFVSIHRNSSPNPNTYSGVETLIYDEGGIKEDMANAINAALAGTGFQNLGINIRKDLAVLRRTNMPALLVEVGFINTDADNQRLDQSFDEVAEAIASGIYETLTGAAFEPGTPGSGGAAGTGGMQGGTDGGMTGTGGMQGGTAGGMTGAGSMQGGMTGNGGMEYRIQVGLYREYRNAMNVAFELEALGLPAEMKASGEFYAVQVGPFRTRAEAVAMENQLQLLGYDTLILERT